IVYPLTFLFLDATTLRWAAAVVRLWGDVGDGADLKPSGGQGADCGLATRARSLDENVDLLHAVLHCLAGSGLGSHLGGERRGLAGTLEADLAGGCPRDDVALRVRDGHDGVVEGGLDVRVTLGHVLLDYATAAAGARSGALRCSHYFFFPAIVFFGPLRVRALVLVRWPRTGRPRRWRSPW